MPRTSLAALGWLVSMAFAAADSTSKWVGSWSTAPQLVETANMPPSPGLANNTLRQLVRLSLGGDTLRVRLSNDFSAGTLVLKSVRIAASKGNGAVDNATSKELAFGGSASVTLDAKSSVVSDPVAFHAAGRQDLAITIAYGQTPSDLTGHPGSRTTSFLLAGDKSTSADFAGAVKTEHWYTINAVDVLAPKTAAAIAILGNSITDGRGSTTDQQNRWPDILSERLLKNAATAQVGVLNLGIGGNCMLSGGLGQVGIQRYPRDILAQSNARWLVVALGVNDVGGVATATAATTTADGLIAAYKQIVADAKAKDMKVYGATIMPFKGNGYYNQYSESCRSTVNKWIRTGGFYDAVIDFDKTTRSASDTAKLGIAAYQNDGLHPDAAGYEKMGESVDANLFVLPASAIDDRRPRASEAAAKGEIRVGKDKSIAVEVGGRRFDGAVSR
jgi:lysophospholipase L1-like esterase